VSKGSNAAWQAAATADLANPTASDKQVAAGDMWWDLADKETAGVGQRGLRRRAGYWYSQAAANPQFAGLKRSLVEKRLAQMPPPGPGEAVAEAPAVVPPGVPENGSEPVPASNWIPLAANGIPPGLVIADVDLKEVDGDYVKFLSGAKGNASFRDHIVAPIQANSEGRFQGPGPKNIETNFYAFFIRNKAQQTAALSLRTSEYGAVNVYLDGNQILAHREDNHNKYETKVPLNLAPGDHAIVIRHRNGWAANWIGIQVEGNNLQTSQTIAPAPTTPAVLLRPIAPNVLKLMDIHGNATTLADGSVRVSGGSLQSLKKYTVPFRADFVAKTDSTNIRISFGKGELIFNWEGHPDLAPLCFSDPAKGPGRVLRINGKGHVPVDQFVQITWIVEEKSTRILVNDEERLQVDGDYAGITAPLAIYPQLGSVVTVSSLSVAEGKSTAPAAANTPQAGGNIFTDAPTTPKDTSPQVVTREMETFAKDRSALPAEKQFPATLARLKELNGGAEFHPRVMEKDGGLRLDFSNEESLVNIEPLYGLNVTKLNLSGCTKLKSLNGLQGMPLTELSLNNCHLLEGDLAVLKGMRLTSLELSECTNLKSLNGLQGMPLSGSFGLYNCVSLEGDLSALAGMQFTHLDLRRCHKLRSLNGIQGMPLTDLCLNNCYALEGDLSELQGMKLGPVGRDRCAKLTGVDDARLKLLASMPPLRAPNYTPERVAPAAPAAGRRVDLLPLIDPKRNAIAGTWQIGPNGLTCEAAKASHIGIPYDPPEEYNLHVAFTSQEGGEKMIMFGKPDHPVSLIFFGNKNQTSYGLGGMDGKPWWNNPSSGKTDTPQNGVRHDCILQVRKDSLACVLDGKQVFNFKTDYTNVNDVGWWSVKPHLFGVGANKSVTQFHVIEVEEVVPKK
jgi:hypothetical protein